MDVCGLFRAAPARRAVKNGGPGGAARQIRLIHDAASQGLR